MDTSAGRGVGQLEVHGELLEELVEGINALQSHESDLDRRLALPLWLPESTGSTIEAVASKMP